MPHRYFPPIDHDVMTPTLLRVLTVFALLTVSCGPTRAERSLSFNRDVRPILSDKCFFCHGPDEEHREADLRLDLSESAHELAIRPGDLQASELITRVTAEDADMLMPPPETGKQLTALEIEVLKRWVAEGGVYEPYWAYVAPQPVATPPPITRPAGVEPDAGTIDRLVRTLLGEQSLRPAPRAGGRSLLRRLHFDLTGLPPSIETIAAFEANPSDAAYLREVDRLLASPAFGERFAEYWLDLVRYADTVGYHGDQTHSIAPYRDYVIDSINDGKPLDQFSREQLAGDLLEDPTTEQRVASGYNRVLQTSHEGGVQPKEYLAIYAADRVRNFSAVWMAATVGCAQCHDHKYDPYTTADFYSLEAFFADIDEAKHFRDGSNALPTRRSPEIAVLGRTDRLRLEAIDRELEQAESAQDAPRVETLRKEKAAIEKRTRRTMITESIPPRTIRLLPRGNWLDDSGPIMRPSYPAFLTGTESATAEQDERLSRLDLANWLFDTENGIGGLTARVFANRLWYLYTGRGISPSLGDFGGQGSPPSNPELLDHLASRLIDSGWDVKRVVREIVSSETYRQAVVIDADQRSIDPANDFASTQSGHRLPAETVRDMVLEIAGLLDHSVGGDTARPYQPDGYYRHLNFPKRRYQADDGARQWRRGVYTHWQRQFLHPMLKALDAPSREECTAQRPRSNTPIEALVLLNDPTFVIAAKAFAARALREVPDGSADEGADRRRLNHMMRLATGRGTDAVESKTLLDLLAAERKRFGAEPAASETFLQTPDDVPISWPQDAPLPERAAWTSVARTIFNLHETLYRP